MKLATGDLVFNFQRVDRDSRVVEGYCFVNERVKGDKYAWKRSAIEDATPDYMKWANVREMHQPSAVGTAKGQVERADGAEPIVLGMTWDEKGAFLRAKIVDDDAWKKCQEGVYSAFSMQIIPEAVKGDEVVRCRIAENSLVDRPKDADCPFQMLSRGDEVEAQELPTDDEAARAEFAKAMESREPVALRSAAMETFVGCLYDTLFYNTYDSPEARISDMDRSYKQFKSYVADKVSRGELEAPERLEPPKTLAIPAEGEFRAEWLEVPGDAPVLVDPKALARFAAAYTDLMLAAREKDERIVSLEKTPSRGRPPVMFTDRITPEQLRRSIDEDPVTKRTEELIARYEELKVPPPPETPTDQRVQNASELTRLKAELRALGVSI